MIDDEVNPIEPQRQRMGGAPVTSEPVSPATPTRMGGAPATSEPASPATPTRMGALSQEPSQGIAESRETHSPVTPESPVENSVAASSRKQWVRPTVWALLAVILAVSIALIARGVRTLPAVDAFVAAFPGTVDLPANAPVGLPAWLGWQHFFNLFFIVLIVRSGWLIRTEKRAPGYWTAKEKSFFSPGSSTPKKISLTQWIHQSLDVLWVTNGVIFVVLLFVTGQWMRIVPLSWEYVPNALSVALQYASLDWPTEDGWLHYNALQVIAYFTTVFVAAPLAAITGFRFSTWWPDKNSVLSRRFPIEWARAVHFPVMIYFVGFTVVHVFLVFFTGALKNLNHMFTARDSADGWGLAIFALAVAVIVAGWFVAKPLFLGSIASRFGTLSK